MTKQYYNKLVPVLFCLFYIACSDNVAKQESAPTDIMSGYQNDSLVYNEQGILTEKLHYSRGQLIGPQYHYFSNGGVKRISYHVANNAVFFEMDYNEAGEIGDMSGVPVFVNIKDKYAYNDNDTSKYYYKAGDAMVAISEVVLIDKIKPVLHTSLVNGEGVYINDTTVYSFGYYGPENMSYYTDYILLRKKGEYKYISRVGLFDSLSGRSLSYDSVVQHIFVE